MAYTTMKKLINNAVSKYLSGDWTAEEYETYRAAEQRKLDVFYANGRLTEGQYQELTNLWVDPQE